MFSVPLFPRAFERAPPPVRFAGTTDSPRTRSSFRRAPASRTPSSSRCGNPRRVPGGETSRDKSPCARASTFTLKIRCTASLISVFVASRHNFEHHGVLRLLHAESLLGDDRPPDYLIEPGRHGLILFRLGLRSFWLCASWQPRASSRPSARLPSSPRPWPTPLSSPEQPQLERPAQPVHRDLTRRKRAAQFFRRFARKHQPVVPHQIVGPERRRRHQRDAFEIAAGALEIHVRAGCRPAKSFAFRRPASTSASRNGLVLCDSSAQPSTTVSFSSANFDGQRRTQRAHNHFLRQRVVVPSRHRAVHRAAVAPERRTNRADARAARALLLPELSARAADFALVLRLVRSRALSRQIVAHGFVQQVLVHLAPKTHRRPAQPCRPSCLRDFSRPQLASSSLFVYRAFLALRIKM